MELTESTAALLTAGVPSESKMYETPAVLEIHSGLHFATKRRMYDLHFVEENNTLV